MIELHFISLVLVCIPQSHQYCTDTFNDDRIPDNGIRCYAEETIPLLNRNIEFLDILDSNMPLLKMYSFRDMQNLRKITIANSNIIDVEYGAFIGTAGLKALSLTQNAITNISRGPFDDFINLESLNLSMNEINYIEKGSFNHVRDIDISNNEIEDVAPLFESCFNLVVLNISYNKVSSLVSIKNCINMTLLNAANNRIKQLPAYLFTQVPLNKLDLSSNIIDSLDVNTFNRLDNLHLLDLSGNRINNGQLKIGIFQHLENLLYLDISSNSLKSLQVGLFSKLSKLETLNISSNELTRFPEEIFHDLENLRTLYINNNLLTTFNGGPNLWQVNIDGNPWNCQELSRIAKLYTSKIVRGSSHTTSNIFGISCNTFNTTNDHVTDKISKLFDRNENISTYVQEFKQNLKELLGQLQKNNNKIQQYLDENQNSEKTFTQTIDAKMDMLLSILNNTFLRQQFVPINSDVINTSNQSHKHEIIKDRLANSHFTENSNMSEGVFVVLTVFLVAFCLTVFYFVYSVKMRHQGLQTDQVQL